MNSRIIFLKEIHHPQPPADLKVEEICSETIIVDGKSIVGQVTYLEGPKESIRGYFRQTGPVWASTNPMVGHWTREYVE